MMRVFGWVKPGRAMKVKNGTCDLVHDAPLTGLAGCCPKGLRTSIIDRTRKMVNYA
jgi:hypothetical protein